MYLASVSGKGGTEAHVVAASATPWGQEIWTVETKSWKLIDAEVEKHRMLSSGSSSSRAIPFEKMMAEADFYPWDVRAAEKGMQGSKSIDDFTQSKFLAHLRLLCAHAKSTMNIYKDVVHKQHINRYLEPWVWQKKVITGTEWDNFFNLRLAANAQPEIQELARCIRKAMDETIAYKEITELKSGQWHLPYVTEDLPIKQALRCSAARCARVSYSNHDKSNPSVEADLKLAAMLEYEKHMTPFEHQASPMLQHYLTDFNDPWEAGVTHIRRGGGLWSANFRGWIQYRQLLQ